MLVCGLCFSKPDGSPITNFDFATSCSQLELKEIEAFYIGNGSWQDNVDKLLEHGFSNTGNCIDL